MKELTIKTTTGKSTKTEKLTLGTVFEKTKFTANDFILSILCVFVFQKYNTVGYKEIEQLKETKNVTKALENLFKAIEKKQQLKIVKTCL